MAFGVWVCLQMRAGWLLRGLELSVFHGCVSPRRVCLVVFAQRRKVRTLSILFAFSLICVFPYIWCWVVYARVCVQAFYVAQVFGVHGCVTRGVCVVFCSQNRHVCILSILFAFRKRIFPWPWCWVIYVRVCVQAFLVSRVIRVHGCVTRDVCVVFLLKIDTYAPCLFSLHFIHAFVLALVLGYLCSSV
jgi:hypothetical protein